MCFFVISCFLGRQHDRVAFGAPEDGEIPWLVGEGSRLGLAQNSSVKAILNWREPKDG